MTRRVNAEGLALLKQWERLVLYAYDDKDGSEPRRFIEPGMRVAGTLTIGWGHTRTVRPGMRITRARADELFLEDLAPCERAVTQHITVPLSDNQFAVLVSFCFNLGPGFAPARGRTPATPLWNIAQTLNSGDYAGAIRRMGLYVNQGGVRNRGLVNRRAAEAGLWVRGDFVASAGVPVEAPPAPPSPAADATALASVAGIAAAVAPAVSGLSGLHWAVGVAAVAGAVLLAGLWLFRRGRAA